MCEACLTDRITELEEQLAAANVRIAGAKADGVRSAKYVFESRFFSCAPPEIPGRDSGKFPDMTGHLIPAHHARLVCEWLDQWAAHLEADVPAEDQS